MFNYIYLLRDNKNLQSPSKYNIIYFILLHKRNIFLITTKYILKYNMIRI